MQTLIRGTTIGFLSLGIAFCASSALGATLTTQNFKGNFTLVDSRTLGEPFPESAEYSGFVTYDGENSLLDWEVNVKELDLSLNPDSNNFGLTPDTTFALSSPSNWDLSIDFGIAFDAPLFTLQRESTKINFSQTSFGSFFEYSDPAANITSVPEPSTIFGSLAFLSTIIILKKRLSSKSPAESNQEI